MIKRTGLLILIAGILTTGFAQKDEVILTIEDEQVTKTEFENIFRKNNRDADVSPEALEEYMQLFLNFKLKVKEAELMGMDTLPEFTAELQGYRNQLARPYLTDSDQNEALLREAYERKLEEIRASHILIKLPANPSPSDTLKAWRKITDIRKKATSGGDFAELARKNSDDPSAKDNGGDLGYFSALQMVYPFETAAYNTPVGKVSQPVRTRFGYHIIKVNDRRPSLGEMKVAHIMIRSNDKDPADRQEVAEKQIRDVAEELKNGADFADLALTYSDDGSSSGKGGELPWFGAGKMVEEFESAAFALEEDGDISEPVKSRFGWHIIKRLDYKPVASYEEMEGELKGRIAKDSRAEKTIKSFVSKLKDEYKFKAYSKNLNPVLNKLDTSIFNGNWDASVASNLSKPLFELDGKTFTQQDFVKYLDKTQRSKRRVELSPQAYGKQLYDKFVQQSIMDYEDSRLEEKYPKFKALMKEYRDGILLFELTDILVWSMAVKDTAGLEAFYEENKNQYTYGERIDGVLYLCTDEKVAKKARKMARKGKELKDIRAKLNKTSNLAVRMEELKIEKGEREYLSHIAWEEGLSDNFEHNNQVAFLHIQEILPPEPKPLKEVRGLVTAAYQNHLEKQWVEELRQKYDYQINKEVLLSIQ